MRLCFPLILAAGGVILALEGALVAAYLAGLIAATVWAAVREDG